MAVALVISMGYDQFKPKNPNDPAIHDAASFIASYEGFSPTSYKCSAGIKTIGFGTTCVNCKEPIDRKQGYQLLIDFLQDVYVKYVPEDLSYNQKIAYLSFIYNVKRESFLSSTLKKKVDAGKYDEASIEFSKWTKYTNPKTGKLEPLSGLVKRRAKERQLWESKCTTC